MRAICRYLTIPALLLAWVALVPVFAAGNLTIAAAADLKFAMEEIVNAFRKTHPDDKIDVIFGSSGKFNTQIQQGAPFDLYFSADIAFPRTLAEMGLAAGPVRPYAIGRIVLWSNVRDASKMTLKDLTAPEIGKIAIANPRHAPYGKRAEEALRSAGIWDQLQDRLVQGENIAQTAQFIQTGNAEVGIIALALALNPTLAKAGGYHLIDDRLHEPLEQGFIITRRAADNPLAAAFADFMGKPEARAIMIHYGFVLPGEQLEK
ncbi:MAG TPA: molybdate ABC transporter substrate-binding protein [Candidatus Competibacteraceae bacterium]|nr:molybdate ABC transporter substrate-binding protein [Candidatus Competibacteraceae bacterium]HRZ07435.1 molybdate ABC transporter substrate-binding protein [Candidatus Competibacteraceae bacterium]HSA46221.1 molybdate ABC transporter substrate-binding protein [Candidatus Competibacteraceae bacterium]